MNGPYNYFLHLVVQVITLQLTCNYFFFHSSIWTAFNMVFIQEDVKHKINHP